MTVELHIARLHSQVRQRTRARSSFAPIADVLGEDLADVARAIALLRGRRLGATTLEDLPDDTIAKAARTLVTFGAIQRNN